MPYIAAYLSYCFWCQEFSIQLFQVTCYANSSLSTSVIYLSTLFSPALQWPIFVSSPHGLGHLSSLYMLRLFYIFPSLPQKKTWWVTVILIHAIGINVVGYVFCLLCCLDWQVLLYELFYIKKNNFFYYFLSYFNLAIDFVIDILIKKF